MNNSKLGDQFLKKSGIMLCMLVLYFPLCIGITWLLFQAINQVDSSAFYRYATENKFSEDVFFSPEIDAKTSIGNTITKTFKMIGNELPDITQAIFHELLKEKTIFLSQLNENKAYMEYLADNNLTVEELIAYMGSISNLSNEILNGSFYFSAVIIFLILYIFFRFRIELYWLAGILYVFSILDVFTSGIFSSIFYKPMGLASKMMGQDYTLNQYNMYIGFLPKIKEAFLTFIIFDTIGQNYREEWNRRRSKKLTEIYCSIGIILSMMRDLKTANGNDRFVKISKLNIDLHYIIKFSKRNKKDLALKEVKELTLMFLRRIKSGSIFVGDVIIFLERVETLLKSSVDLKNDEHSLS
ncbi:hypothetical protein EC604_28025 [Paenibacillus amylolyticus]|uniref:Uncharacterized protein n=1 Tax=Paenibacillus amylolyticus TaxID=1451 RepID=A0A5M9X1B9_PAEAM|nr:hypothetical protein [Paenibacillus amylolyticus]KAA8787686.1 hypothetical protein EC604_28025 [Paenibacillus amylolyticus]